MEFKKLSESLTETITNSDISDLSVELLESSLDSILKDGLLKELPIFKTLFALRNGYLSVQDYLFVKKLLAFLNKSKEISATDRKLMIDKIDNDNDFKVKAGEKLLFIIDKSEDWEKSEIVAILFNHFLQEKISYEEFLQASLISGRFTTNEIKEFIKFSEHNKYNIRSQYFRHSKVEYLLHSDLFVWEIEELEITDEDDRKSYYDGNKYKVEGGERIFEISRIGKIIYDSLCERNKDVI